MRNRVLMAFGLAVMLAAVLVATETSFYMPCDGWWNCIIKATIL